MQPYLDMNAAAAPVPFVALNDLDVSTPHGRTPHKGTPGCHSTWIDHKDLPLAQEDSKRVMLAVDAASREELEAFLERHGQTYLACETRDDIALLAKIVAVQRLWPAQWIPPAWVTPGKRAREYGCVPMEIHAVDIEAQRITLRAIDDTLDKVLVLEDFLTRFYEAL